MKRTKFNWELSRKSIQMVLGQTYPTTHWKNLYVGLEAAKDGAAYQNFDSPLNWTETKNGFISEKTTLGRYKIRKL